MGIKKIPLQKSEINIITVYSFKQLNTRTLIFHCFTHCPALVPQKLHHLTFSCLPLQTSLHPVRPVSGFHHSSPGFNPILPFLNPTLNTGFFLHFFFFFFYPLLTSQN